MLVFGFFALNASAPAGRRLDRIEGVDAVLYFDVAHSMLFDRDFDLSNELRRVTPVPNPWTYVQSATGRPGSPYAIGYSVLATPFLAVGTWVDGSAGRPTDGYSTAARTFYMLANPTFTGLGALFLFSFLLTMGRRIAPDATEPARTWIDAWVVGVMLVATPAAFYAYAGMAHAATFGLAALFLACWARVSDSTNRWGWLVTGFVGGLLSISRWQDIFFLGAPILYDLGNARAWFAPTRRRNWIESRALYGAAAVVCWIPQMLEWKAIYGRYLTIPQGGGFLEFPPRYVLQVLLSTRHGWFVWTPIVALGIAGLLIGARRHGRTFVPWMVVAACEVALTGAMPNNWSGADAFGQRSLTSLVPLLALGTATLLWSLRRPARVVVAAGMAACAAFTLAFAAQFRLNLIPRDGRLTAQELITDKAFLVQAVRRKTAVAQADQLAEAGDFAGATRRLQVAARSFGEDRVLLERLAVAARLAGDTVVQGDAQRRFATLNARELW